MQLVGAVPPKQVRLELPINHYMSVHLLSKVLGIVGVSQNHTVAFHRASGVAQKQQPLWTSLTRTYTPDAGHRFREN